MIKNDIQYKYSKRKIIEFLNKVEKLNKKYSKNKKKLSLLSQGYLEHVSQLKTEITEYEKMKNSPLPRILTAKNPKEISKQLVRMRISHGLTQAQLAEQLGCKQSDISRMEREDYISFSIPLLHRVAKFYNTELNVSFVNIRIQ